MLRRRICGALLMFCGCIGHDAAPSCNAHINEVPSEPDTFVEIHVPAGLSGTPLELADTEWATLTVSSWSAFQPIDAVLGVGVESGDAIEIREFIPDPGVVVLDVPLITPTHATVHFSSDQEDGQATTVEIRCKHRGFSNLGASFEGTFVDWWDRDGMFAQFDSLPVQCGAPLESTSTTGDPTTSTTTTGSETSATSDGTGSSSGDATTGDTGGDMEDVPLGSHPGAAYAEDLHVLAARGYWVAVVAASAGGSFVNLTTDEEIEDLDLVASAAGAVGGGSAAAFAGFPGLRVSQYIAGAWTPMAAIAGMPSSAATAAVPAAGAPSMRVCGASNNPVTVACADASGTDWVLDATSTTDAAWIDTCPTFGTEGLVVSGAWALLLSGSGAVCHGQLGSGTQASPTVSLSADVEGLDCPAQPDGSSRVCAVAESTGTISILSWPTASGAPTLVASHETCDGLDAIEGHVSDDGDTVSIASACGTDDEAHLITVDAADGSLVSHTFLALTDCGGEVAALPTPTRMAIACNGTVEVVDTATFDPV